MASLELLQPKGWTKGCSPTCSNQTDKNNCGFHTLTKMLIKNVFEKVLDLRLTPEENDRYDLCMPLTVPARSRGYPDGKYPLNAEKKVKLFYYLFSLLEYTNSRRVSDALSLLHMPTDDITERVQKGPNKVYFPTIQYSRDPLLLGMKEEFLAKSSHLTWNHIHLEMDSVKFEPIKEKVLVPILALNLYFEMGLEEINDEDDDDVIPKRHIVLITGLDDKNIHIKNTWGKLLHEVPWSDVIILEDGHNYKVTDLHTILPMRKGSEVESEYDARNIDALFDFITKYASNPSLSRGGTRRKRKSKRRTYRS